MSYVLRHTPSGKREGARKLRWVCKGIRTGSGLEARPQAAADGSREAATPTANAAGLQPTQDDGAKTPSRVTTSSPKLLVQQPGPRRALPPAPLRPKPAYVGAALRSSSLWIKGNISSFHLAI
jgi:hypothetical protein